MTQLSLLEVQATAKQLQALGDPYAPYPAPAGMPPYSHRVVFTTCLAWEMSEWIMQRRAAG